MSGEYSFLRFDRNVHAPLLRNLYLKVNGYELTDRDFREKFSTKDVGGEVIGFLAISSSGDVAAYYGVFPVRVKTKGVELIAAQSGNTMTAPEHQGRGLFTQLARLTYAAARDEGIAFVFGFPNKNSYPGFVKKLNWVHRVNMNSYNFFIPTLPISEFFSRFNIGQSFYKVFQKSVLGVFAKKVDGNLSLNTSLSDEAMGGVVRDAKYLEYKKRNLYVLRFRGCEILFKSGRFVDIGDIHFTSSDALKVAIRRLKWIAFLLGVVRVRFYVTPECALDKAMKKIKSPTAGLPYGHIAFVRDCDPDRFAFSFIDYDTY